MTEWYYEHEVIGGAPNYSWSLAYPFFLFYGQILGIKPSSGSLVIEPCISEEIGTIQTVFKYQGKMVTVKFTSGCDKSLRLPNSKIRDGMLIRWKE